MFYRLLCPLSLLLISAIIMVAANRADAVSPVSNLAFIEPRNAGTLLPEIDEFATMVMGDPWDMEQLTDLAHYRSASGMVNSVFANGVYSAQMIAGNGAERITLLTAGAPNNTAMRIGKIGYNYPINANHYRYLTLRVYKSHNQYNSGLIQWFSSDSYNHASMGVSNSFLVPAAAGWHTIVVDLHTIGIQLGGQPWAGTIRELIVKLFAGPGAAGATVKLDWARLTPQDPRTARPYVIRWHGGGGPINLYASQGDKTLDQRDILIAANINAATGEYTFQTGVLPAGRYYIAAEAGGSVVWSDGPLIINEVPTVTIDKPSKTSGADYAETVLGNAWDMRQVSDLNYNLPIWHQQTTCVTDETFVNGIYTAHLVPFCPSGDQYADPILYLGHMDRTPPGQSAPPIDTRKFRYLSYRFFHSGEENVHEGWVVRWGWWQVNTAGGVPEAPVMGRDLMILEEWNVYKVDLWAHDVVDEAHPIQRSWLDSAPNRLRFDPSELNTVLMPAYVQLDWIKLTAVDEVKRGAPFPIMFNLSKPGVQMTFYYDTDTNPNNGRTLIGSTTAASNGAAQPATGLMGGPHQYFLPAIMNNYVNCLNGECFLWDTTNVAPGQYYICIALDDGLNSFYQCSEAPVIVRP